MRYFVGLGNNVGRKLPEGTVQLTVLAALLFLVVFSRQARAATEEWDSSRVVLNESESFNQATTLVIKGDGTVIDIQVNPDNANKGSVSAQGVVALEDASVVQGTALMAGSQTLAKDTPGSGGMYASTLDRRSEAARLVFNRVIVNPGADGLNLGAIRKSADDAFHQGGIYIGGDISDWANRGEALITTSLATTNESANGHLGTILVWGDVTLADGGAITLSGHDNGVGGILGKRRDDTGEAMAGHDVYENAFLMTGGTLDMTTEYGAEIRMRDIAVSGGTVALRADGLYGSDWRSAPALTAGSGVAGSAGTFSVGGDADVTLGDYAVLRTQWDSGGDLAAQIAIGGGTVTLSGDAGKEAVIQANAASDRKRDVIQESSLSITGDASITVAEDKYGVILSRGTTFDGGEINVQGALTVAGAAGDGTDVMTGIKAAREKWGDFQFNGGTMTLGDKGVVDFVTGGMTLTATSGEIDGKLWIVDKDSAAVGTAPGVYAANLTVDSQASAANSFTVSDLAVMVTEKGAAGVAVNGKMVVKNSVSASTDVASGALNIRAGGSLTAGADDFLTFVVDESTGNVTGYTLDDALSTALKNSTGTLNLNAWNDAKELYNLTTEQYNSLKNQLGLSGGSLNLLGVVVGDKLFLDAANGDIDVAVTNPSAQVTIDAGNSTALNFGKEVSVKELEIKNGTGISNVTLSDSGAFTGSGDAEKGIIKGGANDAMNVTARDDLNLGVAGNPDKQGGLLGNIVFVDGKLERAMNVTDGQFRTGLISAADGTNGKIDVNVSRSGSSGQKTVLEADGIDFSGVNASNSTSIAVSDATLTVKDGILLNGNANSTIALDDDASLTARSVAGGSRIHISGGSAMSVTEDIVMTGGKSSDVRVAGGVLTARKLDLGEGGGMVVVGDADSRGTLAVGELALRGGTIFSDPVWKEGLVSIYDASAVFVEKFDNDTSDGNIIVGQNSHFTYGTRNSDWLIARVNEVGVWGQNGSNSVTAALGLYNPLTIGNGYSLTVDGGVTAMEVDNGGGVELRPTRDGTTEYAAPANSANFAADSLLVVNAVDLSTSKAALTAGSGTGTLNVEDGAKLYIYNAKSGNAFKLVDGFTAVNGDIGGSGWNPADNMNDTEMTRVVIRSDGSAVLATVTAKDASVVYENASGGASEIVNDIYGYDRDAGQPKNDVDATDAGIRFISRATSKIYNGEDLNRQAATIEGAAQLSAVGGAQLNAFNIMRLTSDAIRKRFSFSAGLIPHPEGHGQRNVTDAVEPDSAWGSISDRFNVQGKKLMSIWAAPVYQHSNVSGMKVAAFENKFKSNLGGANLGFDFDLGDNFRFGVIGGIGGGKSKTKGGDLAYTDNSFDYFGISGYAAWSTCNLSILVDGGYNRVKNDITQDNWLGGGANRADVKVNAWNVGATAEYLVAAGFADIVPHLSLRYEGVGTNEHRIRSNDGVLFEVKSDAQHVITVPVGVTVSKDFVPGCNWRVTPYADLGALFAMGGKNFKSNVRIPTLQTRGFQSRIVDSAAFNGSVGVSAERGRVFGGMNYNVLSSTSQTSHSLWANIGVSF